MGTNPKKISVTDLRMTTREIIDAVHFKGQHFVVERNGKPMVVVVGVEEYERLIGELGKRDIDLLAAYPHSGAR